METAGIRAAISVLGKALSPLSGGMLEAWASSTKLGFNIEALKLELLEAEGMLNNTRGREIHNTALAELLDRLQQLAYGANDVLDELDYFRIQDELDGTYHAADSHASGYVQDLALNVRHTARACVNKLKFPVCSRAARGGDPDKQDDGTKQGCLSGLRPCGRRGDIGSSPQLPADHLGVQEARGGCMPKAANNVGKHFSCFSLPSVDHDATTAMVKNPKRIGENEPLQTPKLKFDRVGMSKKILDIIDQLKPLCARVSNILSLELLSSSRTPTQDIAMNRPKTTPQIIEPKLYGRDSHKKIVADEIVNAKCCELTVLPIVGPGGIGKTTFTQHVYEQMKSHFEVSIWICVSLYFNANKLAEHIVKKIPQVSNENKNCSDEELIEQRLKGKRILLVLDDVWKYHENEWKRLIAMFTNEGVKGNMVIVTTRIPEVANMIKTTKCSLELECLCPEDIMSFFEDCVFGDQKPWVDHLELSDVGSKIVEKLKGSPLAAKTVGRLLRNRLTLDHWRSILESKEWESQTDENDIMPALKLSYDYLPFHQQQCFSFCSLFPEDYEFGSEELVHFWIGLDILNSFDKKNKRIEDVGLGCLNDLVNNGFFKMNEKENGRPYYIIHDLLHELAVKVSSYECLSICSSNSRDIQIHPSVRHLSITVGNTDVEDRMSFEEYDGNLSALDKRLKVENLHTLMLFGEYHQSFAKTFRCLFREARALRIISLFKVSYDVEDVFCNFSKLVHLHYLRIEALPYWELILPSALFRLYHLEVIDLQTKHLKSYSENMKNLVKKDMRNLVKMRHFLLPDNMFHLYSDIYAVGKLKFFRYLRNFIVAKENEGFELSQLGKLTEIGGSLSIYNLEKVQTKEDANELKLVHKKHIRELILEWDAKRCNKDPVKEDSVLASLVPHSDLQELHIKEHGGTNCPTWLCSNLSVKSLGSLCLDGVCWKNLPPIGEVWMVNEFGEEYKGFSISPISFHNLKKLQLRNISRLTKWVGNGACPFFSHLEVLIFRDCSELMELPFSNPAYCEAQQEEKMGWFPKLRELVIVNCPKLALVPSIPWQTGAPCSAEIISVGSGFRKLVYRKKYKSELSLEIEGNNGKGDVLWNGLNFSNLTDLKELQVTKIPPLPLDELQLLTSLKMIHIHCSSKVLPPVEGKGHGIYRFPVEDLTISHCDTSGEELTLLLSFLPNLSKLRIEECKNVTRLGVSEHAKTVSLEQKQQTSVEQKQQTREEEIVTVTATEGQLLFPPQIQELQILRCPKASLLSDPPQDTHTEVGGGGIQRLCSLRDLWVSNCPEFLSAYPSPSSSFLPFPTSLQYLNLEGVKHMETLQALSNLTSLTHLSLSGMRGSRAEGLWPLLAHGNLSKLHIFSGPTFFDGSDPSRPHDKEVFSCSSKLLDLKTGGSTGFLAAPTCSLFSSTLTRLDLSFDYKTEHLTKEQEEALQLLTSLQDLHFSWGPRLQHLPEGLHKLINLKKLLIFGCPALQSLPSLPSSLQKLVIRRCGAIKSLPNSLPTSLEILKIIGCKAIKSLPKNGLPSSLRELDVTRSNSEELKRECRKLIGTIPIVIT
ncbi:hypothetical protein ACQ4PT_041357 [Festuca glaucescens]